MLLLAPVPTALAGDIAVEEVGDLVRATVVVAAPVSDVLALIRNPTATASLCDQGDFTVAPAENGCFDVSFALQQGLVAVAYRALSCPTASGMRTELVQSDTFRKLNSEWTVRPVAAGTEIAYSYRAELSLPLPSWLVRRSTLGEISNVMDELAARFR
jgi:hypothetical protein